MPCCLPPAVNGLYSTELLSDIPRALESYPSAANQTLASELAMRVQVEPFNALATGVFVLAILHTFAAARFTAYAHRVQHRRDDEARAQGRPPRPSMRAEVIHFLGEVEVVFGLWAVLLMVGIFGVCGMGVPLSTISARPSITPSRCSWS